MKEQPIGAVGIKLELIAIGDVGRMFHAEMGRFDNANLLRAKWIWSEILFVKCKILFLLFDKPRRFFKIFGNNIENDRQRLARNRFVSVLDGFVWCGVKNERIIGDRVGHVPVVGRGGVVVLFNALEFTRTRSD